MEIKKSKKEMAFGTFLFILSYTLFLARIAIGNTTFAEYISIYGVTLIVVTSIGLFYIGIKLVTFDRHTVKAWALIGIITVIFLAGYKYSTYVDLIILIVLMIGSKNIKLDDIVKCHFIVYGIVTLIALICASLGVIENYALYSSLRGYRYSMGNTYPTDFAAGVFYLVLDFVYLERNKWRKAYSLGIILLSWCVYRVSDANTSFILSCCIAIAMLIIKSPKGMKLFSSKLMQHIIVWSFPVLAFLSIGIQYIYASVNRTILYRIDLLLNNRIAYGNQAIEKYNLSLFGKHIQLVGAGWGTSSDNYFYVDNGYLQVALIYGILLLCIFCLGFSYVNYKNKYRQTNPVLSLILFFIAISGLIEPRFFNILYNSFIFAISIELFLEKKESGQTRKDHGGLL
jgi:hypothetical protein